jgi:hypothetical protein
MKYLWLVLILSGCFWEDKGCPVCKLHPKRKAMMKLSKPRQPAQLFEESKLTQNNLDIALIITNHCSYSCGGETLEADVTDKFYPPDHGLYTGDGSSSQHILWRSLTMTLNLWGRKQCLDKAAIECGSAQKVKSFKLDSQESGDWWSEATYACKESFEVRYQGQFHQSEYMLSPFDPTLNPMQMKVKRPFMPNWREKNLESSITENEDCKRKITMDACFGDCIFELPDGSWLETLATNGPLGENLYTFCGDDFYEKLNSFGKNFSADLKQYYCEEEVRKFIIDEHILGSSCQAFRGKIDCSSVID